MNGQVRDAWSRGECGLAFQDEAADLGLKCAHLRVIFALLVGLLLLPLSLEGLFNGRRDVSVQRTDKVGHEELFLFRRPSLGPC